MADTPPAKRKSRAKPPEELVYRKDDAPRKNFTFTLSEGLVNEVKEISGPRGLSSAVEQALAAWIAQRRQHDTDEV